MSKSRGSGRERGAAAVEMAIVLPLLLLVLAGIIDFSRAFFTNMSLSTAAREGARAAVMLPNISPACPVVDTCIKQRANVASPTALVTVNQNCVGANSASLPAKVTASAPGFDYVILDGIMGLFSAAPGPPILSEVAEMRCNA